MGQVTLAFEEEVDLIEESCAECGLPLIIEPDPVGMVEDLGDGVPVARVWHLSCAPARLRLAAERRA